MDPVHPAAESSRPDAATWLTFAIAVIVTLVAAFYRAAGFGGSSRALAAGLAAPVLILIICSVGYFRHVRQRRNWRTFLVFSGRAAVVVSGLGLLADWNRGPLGRPPSYPVADLRAGKITYLQFVRSSREQDAAHFDATFKAGIVRAGELGWRESDPSAFVRDVHLRITDDDEVFRGQVDYVVQTVDNGAPQSVHSRVIALVHGGGVATLESSCLLECGRADLLMAESEERVRTSLGSSSLDEYLPAGGDCWADESAHPQTGALTPTFTCEYQNITLSFSRKSNQALQREIAAWMDRNEAR